MKLNKFITIIYILYHDDRSLKLIHRKIKKRKNKGSHAIKILFCFISISQSIAEI